MGLFDLHCDTLCEGLHKGASIRQNSGAIDLCRGGIYQPWVQVFAAWIPDGLSVLDARRECDALLEVAERWASQPDFDVIHTAADLVDDRPGCRALLSVENGGALDADPEYLAQLHRRGVRMITLTWNGDNHWASGCFGTTDRGLTLAGSSALTVMERLGILVDVSHLNATGFRQICDCTQAPFVASHSASAAVCDHPRNLTDEQFCAIRDRGGVVGLSLSPEHLGGEDFETIRCHLEHFMALDGEHTICFGADFDGMTAPKDWNGISVMHRIRQHLAAHGWRSEQLDAVFYSNARDFFLRRWTQTIRNEE